MRGRGFNAADAEIKRRPRRRGSENQKHKNPWKKRGDNFKNERNGEEGRFEHRLKDVLK